MATFSGKGVHQLVSFQVIFAGLKKDPKSPAAQAERSNGNAKTTIFVRRNKAMMNSCEIQMEPNDNAVNSLKF
jgi:hypothetical protein